MERLLNLQKLLAFCAFLFTFFLNLFLFNPHCFAQAWEPHSSDSLDLNNLKVHLSNSGTHMGRFTYKGNKNWFFDLPTLEAPKGSGKYSGYANALWIAGISPNGDIHTAGGTYKQAGVDYTSGPIRKDWRMDTLDQMQFDKIYKVTSDEVEIFKNAFREDTSFNINNHPNIRDYLGTTDDPDYRTKILPFVDVNRNGIYDPADGDYPSVMGDQMCRWIINDQIPSHTETRGLPLGIEAIVTAYMYKPINECMDNTVFFHINVTNRSDTAYRDTYIGIWDDSDIGFAFNDFTSCDTSRNTAYVYKATLDDSPYGLNPPATAIRNLRGPLVRRNDHLDNNRNGLIDEPDEDYRMSKYTRYDNDIESPMGNPFGSVNCYNYLSGKWIDDTYWVDDRLGNGDGHLDSLEVAPRTNHYAPDYPGVRCTISRVAPEPKWVESTGKSDKRVVISMGPFNFVPGQSETIEYSISWARDESNSYDDFQYGSLCKALECSDEIQEVFDNLKMTDRNNLQSDYKSSPFNLVSNSNQHQLQIKPDFTENYKIQIFNVNGQLVHDSESITSNTISTEGMSAGIYVVKLKFPSGKFYTQKWLNY